MASANLFFRARLDKRSLGAALRRARLRKGWRLRDVAERIGVTPAAVSNYEQGLNAPPALRLLALARALDLPLR